MLDLAYAVRQILAESGLATDGVCEILAHSTDRNPAAAELATANAYACLAELEHYCRFGYGPDEPACGLPPFGGDRRALANTQVLAGLEPGDYDALFYPGGHGPLWDLVDDRHSIAMIEASSDHGQGRPSAGVSPRR